MAVGLDLYRKESILNSIPYVLKCIVWGMWAFCSKISTGMQGSFRCHRHSFYSALFKLGAQLETPCGSHSTSHLKSSPTILTIMRRNILLNVWLRQKWWINVSQQSTVEWFECVTRENTQMYNGETKWPAGENILVKTLSARTENVTSGLYHRWGMNLMLISSQRTNSSRI